MLIYFLGYIMVLCDDFTEGICAKGIQDLYIIDHTRMWMYDDPKIKSLLKTRVF